MTMVQKAVAAACVALCSGAVFAGGRKDVSADPLRFDAGAYEERTASYEGRTLSYRAYEGIVYVAKPVDAKYQRMNIYVPSEYFAGQTVNGYTAKTAPIFFPNSVGGYMPAEPGTLEGRMGGESASLVALAKGMVVAAPGARGRTTQAADGTYTGKAPACIVDLKAAVRYLRHNAKLLPGNTKRIISNGTSAGGGLSALLAATGNSADYKPYLDAIGAADERDDVYAASCYCPITNLDHANEAYEWQFKGRTEYSKIDVAMIDYHVERKEVTGTLSAAEMQTSQDLAAAFPAYVNGLKLRRPGGAASDVLRLNDDGTGSFADYVESFVERSVSAYYRLDGDVLAESDQQILDAVRQLGGKMVILPSDSQADVQKVSELAQAGAFPLLNVATGEVEFNYAAYIDYIKRQKLPGAFDSLAADTGENSLFGDEHTAARHFTDYAFAHDSAGAGMAEASLVKMMNPLNYIGKGSVTTARYWRIRHGTKDRDTSFAIPVILATALQNAGYTVDLWFPWEVTHSGDYDLPELFAWIESICK